MGAFAALCLRYRTVVVVCWLAVLGALTFVGRDVGPTYASNFELPNTESTRAVELLTRTFPAAAGESDRIVVRVSSGTVRDPDVRARLDPMFTRVETLPHVTGVTGPYDNREQISPDGTIAIALLHFDKTGAQLDSGDVRRVISVAESARRPGLQIALGGHAIADSERFSTRPSEVIGLVAAAIVLFLAFGSLLAMVLPILTAIVALGSGLALITLLTHVFSVAEFAPALATLLGLGVGVDYALFIVTRFRQQIQAGASTEEAVVTAVNTSGRAVFFAGLTVCVAVLGMFALGISFLHGIALAAALSVAATMVAALTLLPALLGFFGRRVLSRREQRRLQSAGPSAPDIAGRWMRWAQLVQRRPALALVAGLIFLGVLAVPALSLRLGVGDEGNNPTSSTSRRAYDLVARGFGPGFNGPFEISVDTRPAGSISVVDQLVRRFKELSGVAVVLPPQYSPSRAASVVVVVPTTGPQEKPTGELLNRLRRDVIPAVTAGTGVHAYVGGSTASFADFSDVLTEKMPQFVGVVVLVSFLVLMMVFRSLLVPLKAALLNFTSIAAAFGVVVAIFQWGWGASAIGVTRTGPVESFFPVMLFAILFGLSMDYEVFLVARMHEEWMRSNDNAASVTRGLATTGRVVTAAAAVMVIVFTAFIFGGERVIKLFGVGFAVAVLVDALVIRTLLVPAAMQLMGRANWWLPRWLDRLLPQVRIEEERDACHFQR